MHGGSRLSPVWRWASQCPLCSTLSLPRMARNAGLSPTFYPPASRLTSSPLPRASHRRHHPPHAHTPHRLLRTSLTPANHHTRSGMLESEQPPFTFRAAAGSFTRTLTYTLTFHNILSVQRQPSSQNRTLFFGVPTILTTEYIASSPSPHPLPHSRLIYIT